MYSRYLFAIACALLLISPFLHSKPEIFPYNGHIFLYSDKQRKLNKALTQAMRPANIRFMAEHYDQIQKLRNHYNPKIDGSLVTNMWNNFLKKELQFIVKAVEPIFRHMFQENSLAINRAIEKFKEQLKEMSDFWKEYFLIETEVAKMRDPHR